MVGRKEKTLSYRRALWLNENPASISLGSCIKQATAKLKSIDDRTITRDNGQLMKLLSLNIDKDGGIFLHLSIETPGEPASIVPSLHGVNAVDISTTKPPPNTEFMDGDAFLYVQDDDVCLCSTIIRDGAIAVYLQDLFAKAALRKDARMFHLEKVADIDKVKLLHAQGVKEIQIRATLYEASTKFSKRQGQTVGVVGAAAKQIKAILGKEHDVTNDALQVTLNIRTDKRRKGMQLGEERITTLAEDLLQNQEDNDEYVIVTKKGQRIGPKEIYMKSTTELKSHGKSVERTSAWNALEIFFNSLRSMGATEQ